MTNQLPLIIFDLDGTLVDSNRDLIPALNAATATEGLPPISMEDVGHVVGLGALMMIERAYRFYDRPLETNGPVHKAVFAHFLEYYEARIADNTVFFPDALTTLDLLSQQGYHHAICTNKYEGLARKLLRLLGEEDRFITITGGDTFAVKKPDSTHIVETAKMAGYAADNCIMIGDSINDIAAAQNGNIPVVAVDFGYSDVPVAQLNPDRIISHFTALPQAIEELRQTLPAQSVQTSV